MAGAPIGNQNAVKQNRIITDTLRRVIAQNPDKVRQACENLLDEAAKGNLSHFKEMTDRHEGKSVQPTELSGPDGGPIELNLRVEFVG